MVEEVLPHECGATMVTVRLEGGSYLACEGTSPVRLSEVVERPVIAEMFPASRDSANALMHMAVGEDGRSKPQWLRLANGDLILGTFPTGEGYSMLENAVQTDYEIAVRDGKARALWAEELGTVQVGPGITPLVGDVRY